jgi:hypothetical protein
MVRNSIGVSTCDDRSGLKVDYVIRRGDKGQPQDFFQAKRKDTWYWALDGFLLLADRSRSAGDCRRSCEARAGTSVTLPLFVKVRRD